MRIAVIGDVHGEFGKFWENVQKLDVDAIIQVGDFGWWMNRVLKEKENLTNLMNHVPIYFVRGNHEEYTRGLVIDGNPDAGFRPYFNAFDKIMNTFKDVKYPAVHLDGVTKDFSGATIGFVGGANSYDKQYRLNVEREQNLYKKGEKLWWEDEAVNAEKANALANVNIDIMVSHNCPASAPFPYLEGGDNILSKLYSATAPKFWFFGHHHKYFDMVDDRSGTHFICLPEHHMGYVELNIEGGSIRNKVYGRY